MTNNLTNMKILIVDDEPTNINILGELLSGYDLKIAVNGKKAIEIVKSDNPPDLILLDIVMPGLDGYEVCKTLKSDNRTRKIPIIFITAKNEETDEAKGLSLGAVDYIRKPFSKAILKSRVQTLLELKLHRDFIENLLKERTQELEETQEEYMKLFTKISKP